LDAAISDPVSAAPASACRLLIAEVIRVSPALFPLSVTDLLLSDKWQQHQ
jgi:hypothetical protein